MVFLMITYIGILDVPNGKLFMRTLNTAGL